jgi:deoxyadenosine/deoxycytidine kinase
LAQNLLEVAQLKTVISLQGFMAAGKTTLARRLENKLKEVTFAYENPLPIFRKRKELKLDLKKEEDFIINQRLFLEAEIERFHSFPNHGKIILDRGPEDIEFFALHYPISIDQNWKIETRLKNELEELRKCRSNYIIYLDVNEKNLWDRRNGDQKQKRGSFEKLLKMYPYEKEWYKKFNTLFIDANEKSPEEVENSTLNYFKKIGFIN